MEVQYYLLMILSSQTTHFTSFQQQIVKTDQYLAFHIWGHLFKMQLADICAEWHHFV